MVGKLRRPTDPGNDAPTADARSPHCSPPSSPTPPTEAVVVTPAPTDPPTTPAPAKKKIARRAPRLRPRPLLLRQPTTRAWRRTGSRRAIVVVDRRRAKITMKALLAANNATVNTMLCRVEPLPACRGGRQVPRRPSHHRRPSLRQRPSRRPRRPPSRRAAGHQRRPARSPPAGQHHPRPGRPDHPRRVARRPRGRAIRIAAQQPDPDGRNSLLRPVPDLLRRAPCLARQHRRHQRCPVVRPRGQRPAHSPVQQLRLGPLGVSTPTTTAPLILPVLGLPTLPWPGSPCQPCRPRPFPANRQ